jgi:glutamine synthetase
MDERPYGQDSPGDVEPAMLRIFAKAVTKHKRIASEIRQLPRRGLRRSLIDRYLRIKEAELARYHAEVTEWEQREYFELF